MIFYIIILKIVFIDYNTDYNTDYNNNYNNNNNDNYINGLIRLIK